MTIEVNYTDVNGTEIEIFDTLEIKFRNSEVLGIGEIYFSRDNGSLQLNMLEYYTDQTVNVDSYDLVNKILPYSKVVRN